MHSEPSVAVIGAGRWGQHLLANLHELGALAAVAEARADRAHEIARRFPSLPLFDDHRRVIDSKLRAVAIATPSSSHFAIARDCLRAGKDVFVEKPMALAAEQADELVRLADDHGRVLMVGHLLLYQPALQRIRAAIGSGLIGRPCALHHERLDVARPRAPEHVLWCLGVHDVAVACFLAADEPCAVTASGHRGSGEAVEDAYVQLRFPSGLQAHLHVSLRWPQRRRQLVVHGDEGMLVYDELAQTVTLHRVSCAQPALDGERLFEGASEPVRLEMQHFLARLDDAHDRRTVEQASARIEAGAPSAR